MCPKCKCELVFETYDPKTNNIHVLCVHCGNKLRVIQKNDEETI